VVMRGVRCVVCRRKMEKEYKTLFLIKQIVDFEYQPLDLFLPHSTLCDQNE
jgi:hypothetical protein